jgi:lipase maturation factor 1
MTKHAKVMGLFVRCLGGLYLISFAHLSFQVEGLIGSHGISPVSLFLRRTRELTGYKEFGHILLYPSIFWMDCENESLVGACVVGVMVGAALVLGRGWTRLNLFILYLLKLSFCVVGGDLFAFPWDYLLMEATVLSLFLPGLKHVEQGVETVSEPRPVVRLSLVFLSVRFMLAMGLEKIPFINGCEAWMDMTYVKWFYEREQPMPTALAWFFFHLPMPVHYASVWITWVIELFVPLLVCFPCLKVRRLCGITLMLFQAPIMATGNYSILNWLSIVLCLPILDDDLFVARHGHDDRTGANTNQKNKEDSPKKTNRKCGFSQLFSKVSPVIVPLLLGAHGAIGTMYTFRIAEDAGISYLANPNWLYDRRYQYSWSNIVFPRSLLLWLQRYHIVGQWGGVFFSTFEHDGKHLFIIEGSQDGIEWKEYEYKYHVQRIDESPRFFAPFFPRMDHMIFYESNQISFNNINPFSPLYNPSASGTWFIGLVQRLLEAEKDVLDLFRFAPFGKEKPLYIRVNLYQYKFTDSNIETEEWWRREKLGIVLPPVSLIQPIDNTYAVCYYVSARLDSDDLSTVDSYCREGKTSNSVFDFEEPTNIFKKSTFLASSLPLALPSAYLNSIRELLSWNNANNLSQDYAFYRGAIETMDRCEQKIVIDMLLDGKERKLYAGGLGVHEIANALVRSQGLRRNVALNEAKALLESVDKHPSWDNLVTIDEIMECVECYTQMCGEHHFF